MRSGPARPVLDAQEQLSLDAKVRLTAAARGITLGPGSPLHALASAKPPRARSKHAEHGEQALLMQWLATLPARTFPGARFSFAVPNAARRGPALAAYLKREGLRAGVFDVIVTAPRALGPLWIEMKDPAKYGTKKGLPTPDQHAYHRELAALGYAVAVCYGFHAAMAAVQQHYSTRPTPTRPQVFPPCPAERRA